MTLLLIQFCHEPIQLFHYCDWLLTGSPGFRFRYGHSNFTAAAMQIEAVKPN
jgi:hypothetical protein